VDLSYPADSERYRESVRSLLREILPKDWKGLGALSEAEASEFAPWWRGVLRDNRLLAPDWPAEYGGQGLTLLERSILAEELMKVGAPQYPEPNDSISLVLLAPTVLYFGSEEQKAQFLPGTLSGEYVWAQGYSEPDAGSDLFSLRTKAEQVGDTWQITGQKIWQTAGLTANWIFVLARTDPTSRGGKGLSFFLLPLDQPGVTVRGIRNMAGQIDFTEVFFDKAEALDAHLVGGEGNGAKVALGLLGFERGAGGMSAVAAARIELDRLVRLARDRGLHRDASLRRRIASSYADVHVMRCVALRSLSMGLNDEPPGAESSITKILASQHRQRVSELAVDVLGPDAVAFDGPVGHELQKPQPLGTDALSSGPWVQDVLQSRPATIYGGALQIQRNTIGERVLGLPRDPRPVPSDTTRN
jgi:alkylation response protein AidB-like acyl-CoA dehydrogenase